MVAVVQEAKRLGRTQGGARCGSVSLLADDVPAALAALANLKTLPEKHSRNPEYFFFFFFFFFLPMWRSELFAVLRSWRSGTLTRPPPLPRACCAIRPRPHHVWFRQRQEQGGAAEGGPGQVVQGAACERARGGARAAARGRRRREGEARGERVRAQVRRQAGHDDEHDAQECAAGAQDAGAAARRQGQHPVCRPPAEDAGG